MKLLIVRDDARGDVLLTTPAVSALKQKYPDAEIHYLARREASQVLVGNPDIFKIHSFENCGSLSNIVFDVAYDLRDRPGPSPWTSQETIRAIDDPIMQADTHSRISRHKNERTFANLYADVCGVNLPPAPHNVMIMDKDVAKQTDHQLQNLGLLDREYIVCSFDSCWGSKRIPGVIASELIDGLMKIAPVVLIGKSNTVKRKTQGNQFYNMTGRTTIMQAARIIQQASLYVGIDSLPLHIADTFGISSVSIWTATRPNTILTSGRKDTPVFTECSCAPCFSQRCSNGRECLPSVTDILNAAGHVFGKPIKQQKVWIVMPALDQVHLTLQAIDSIDRNTFGVDYEIILVDDGGDLSSQNCYRAIDTKYPRVRIIRKESNSGFVASTNAGIREALNHAQTCDYILWLNNDVIAEDIMWLKKLLDVADENSIVGPVGSRLRDTFNHTGYVTTPGASVHYIDGWCLLAPVSAYEATAVGMLDSNIKSFSEDADWCIRAARAGYTLKVVGQVGILHLHHQTFKAMNQKDAHIPSLHYMREKWGTLEAALQPAEVVNA